MLVPNHVCWLIPFKARDVCNCREKLIPEGTLGTIMSVFILRHNRWRFLLNYIILLLFASTMVLGPSWRTTWRSCHLLCFPSVSQLQSLITPSYTDYSFGEPWATGGTFRLQMSWVLQQEKWEFTWLSVCLDLILFVSPTGSPLTTHDSTKSQRGLRVVTLGLTVVSD